MKIYISIPITGHDLQEQTAKAEKLAAVIRTLGHEPVSPFDTPAAPSHLTEQEAYSYYIGCDLEQLLLCDGAYFVRGWERSRGCNIEHEAAVIYELRIFHKLDQIPEAQ